MVSDTLLSRIMNSFKRKIIIFIPGFFIVVTLFNILICGWNLEKVIQLSILRTVTCSPLLLLVILIFYFESRPVSIPTIIIAFTTCLLAYLLILIIVEEYRPWAIEAYIFTSSFFLMELGKLIYKRRRCGNFRC